MRTMPISPPSISEAAQRLTEANGGQECAPAPFAAVSPFHEVLVQDVATTLPPEWRAALGRSTTVEELNDWLAAGAMLRWTADSPHLRRTFIHGMGADPRQAARNLVEAVARQLPPLPPTEEQRAADARGVQLAVTLAALVLALRASLVIGLTMAGVWSTGWPAVAASAPAAMGWPTAAAGVALLTGYGPGATATAIVIGAGTLWHALEFAFVSGWLGRIRQWPARRRGVQTMPQRADAFVAAWRTHAGLLWAAHAVRLSLLAAGELSTAAVPSSHAVVVAVIAVLASGLLVVRRSRQDPAPAAASRIGAGEAQRGDTTEE